MADERKALSYIGFAARAGKAPGGEFSTLEAIKKGKAKAVFISGDASDNTKKKFRDKCTYYHVPMAYIADRQTLGKAVGKTDRTSVAVTDASLAEAAIKALH
ncbi:MAG: ribosomal L7Ae/L30e/S12e/Gadd45 family protein [Eubacteriales bacterium]